MWGLDYKESWALKNWCFWTVVLEKTLESPLDHKEIKPVNPKGNQPWIFTGRTDAEAETPVLWPLDANNWLIGKDSNAGKDWRWEWKGITEDQMVGWHHRHNGHEFGWTPGVSDGQGGLACCWWGHRVRHDWATELNWTGSNKMSLGSILQFQNPGTCSHGSEFEIPDRRIGHHLSGGPWRFLVGRSSGFPRCLLLPHSCKLN